MKNYKGLLFLSGALFVASLAQAQTQTPDRVSRTSTTNPTKSMKVENVEEKKTTDKAEKEEKFVWSYSVVEVYGKAGEYTVMFEKPSGEMTPDMKRTLMMTERIQAASNTFKSEMDILQMFTDMEMELITVLVEESPKGPKKVFYTRRKSPVQ